MKQQPIDPLALNAIGQEGGPTGQEWARTNYYWCRWSAKLVHQPRIALEVVQRRLVGTMAKIDNFVESKKYAWTRVATLSRACG